MVDTAMLARAFSGSHSGLHVSDTNPVNLFPLSLLKQASPTLPPSLAPPVLLQPSHGVSEDLPGPAV